MRLPALACAGLRLPAPTKALRDCLSIFVAVLAGYAFGLFLGVFMLIKRDCGAVRLYVNARGQWVAQWIVGGEPLPVVALFDTKSGALAYALSSNPPPLE